MNRLLHTLNFDLRLQMRYGFIVASFFSILVWLAVLLAFPPDMRRTLAPVVVLMDLAIVGFYFLSGLVLYEKGEATLHALVVTPLRFAEYLTSKLVTLTLLALVISLLLLWITVGATFHLLYAVLGILLMALISLLVGFITVAPFPSFSSYIIPSSLPVLVLYLPILAYIGLGDGPIYYLLPSHGAMLLLGGAFGSIEPWQVLYAVLYGALWIVGLMFVARAVFRRFMLAR